ncbi:hypothetical protein [Paenibacillus radicis (ex Gao et al. 2016)]|uniref:Uncharacterized protein n=1 Tax=Paenibacillus radicis (ex Gao et al. 2016) TaxID=1737354 RepID=A0A917H418_9BACL|nr:hypothetical protein [Paenibacillus radicis (ex Gao et al. 2016)]GGG66948.1 hypothetical protein GCM10010918_21830 [Paenibacillus radicis (ex Gao et al. 2016)]
MNHKTIISRVALSALIMSSIAGAAIANAATGNDKPVTTTGSYVASQDVKFDSTKTLSVVNSFTNPLELAKKYAPETENDWKSILAAYDKAISNRFANVPVGEAVAVDGASAAVSLQAVESVNIKDLDLSDVKVLDAKDLKVVGDVKLNGEFAATTAAADGKIVKGEFIKGEAIDAGKLAEISKDGAASLVPAAALEASDSDKAFLRAEIALAKAVESKDAAAIKESLAKLYEQYKLQIEQWEAAAE